MAIERFEESRQLIEEHSANQRSMYQSLVQFAMLNSLSSGKEKVDEEFKIDFDFEENIIETIKKSITTALEVLNSTSKFEVFCSLWQ